MHPGRGPVHTRVASANRSAAQVHLRHARGTAGTSEDPRPANSRFLAQWYGAPLLTFSPYRALFDTDARVGPMRAAGRQTETAARAAIRPCGREPVQRRRSYARARIRGWARWPAEAARPQRLQGWSEPGAGRGRRGDEWARNGRWTGRAATAAQTVARPLPLPLGDDDGPGGDIRGCGRPLTREGDQRCEVATDSARGGTGVLARPGRPAGFLSSSTSPSLPCTPG